MGQTAFVDMLGRQVDINFPPKRIVSLVPSQTELLYDLGLESEVVGITKFCIHPNDWFRTKTRVGGTKNVDLNKVAALQPDLIIANKEENVKEQIEALSNIAPVWVSDIQDIAGSLQMIAAIGTLTGTENKANHLASNIKKGFNGLRCIKEKRVAYLIWHNPWMCAGGGTFIDNILEHMGWENVFKEQTRYPVLTNHDFSNPAIDLFLLSSEPYPFKDGHIALIKAVNPNADVWLVDGEMFSWYGSRLLSALTYLQGLIDAVQ